MTILDTIELSRTVPVIKETDVLVVGGGPAGIGAAVSAARQGVSVLLIERYGFLGGVFTTCEVPGFMGFTYFGKRIVSGLAWELVETLNARDMVKCIHMGSRKQIPLSAIEDSTLVTIDGEYAKQAFANLVLSSGATILLHTWVSAALHRESAIDGVIAETRDGPKALRTKVVIDATGDGHIAALSGVPYTGDSQTNQAKSLVFRLGDVDELDIKEVKAQIRHDQQIGIFPFPSQRLTNFIPLFAPGQVMVNMTQTGGDSIDCWEMTTIEMTLREQMWKIYHYLKEHIHAFKNAYIVASGVQAGIRQSRNFQATHTLTESDVRSGARFNDAIALAGGTFGTHDPSGTHFTYHERLSSVCHIPYRCLVPRDIDGLLLTGRCIGVEPKIQDTIRLMPTCMATGSAAGIAAALAVQNQCRARNIPIVELQTRLRQTGAILDI